MLHLRPRFEPESQTPRHFPMEGLRAIAIILVFFVHFHSLSARILQPGPLLSISEWADHIGHSGVDLFFVLSGFLIYGAIIRKPIRFAPYMSRRIQRIYPAFLVILSAYLILSLLMPAHSRIPSGVASQTVRYLAANLLLLPGILDIEPVVRVAWSLSYEFCFYLAAPLAANLLRLRSRKRSDRIAFLVACGIVFALAGWMGWTRHVRFLLFVAGMLLFEIVNRPAADQTASPAKASRRYSPFLAVVLGMAAIAASGWFQMGIESRTNAAPGQLQTIRAILLAACLLPVAYSAISGCSWLSAALSWTPLRWLGNMSYSFYLAHGLALQPLRLFVDAVVSPGAHHPWLLPVLFAGAFAIAVVFSAALYLSVEEPYSIRKWPASDRRSAVKAVQGIGQPSALERGPLSELAAPE